VAAMRRTARLAGGLLALVLLAETLTACGRPPGDQPSPAAESAEPSELASTPRPVPSDQRFGLEDSAHFDDGLLLEIAGTEAATAKDTDRGAEQTNGEIVVASIRLENHTGSSYDPRQMIIVATYDDGQAATVIQDETGELTTGFGEEVLDGDEGVATIGFAIPASALDEVSITLDPNDDVHEPVSFTGAVH
jgi:hypothetical protein